MEIKGQQHGGNIHRFCRETGFKPEDILDFSASINPLGPPDTVRKAIKDNLSYLRHYPDPEAGELTTAIARHLDMDPHLILPGNGSTELIYLLIRVLRPTRVLIPAPTYSEYEAAFRSLEPEGDPQGKIRRLFLSERDSFTLHPDQFIQAMADEATKGSGLMAFLCNPNNPTGFFLKRSLALEIAKAAREMKCHLVVDEAYLDFVPEAESLVKEVALNPYLIVLRSLTKFYGCPGLRLGFGVFPPHLITALTRQKEPWSVNYLAQVAGVAAFSDESYRLETLRILAEGKETLLWGFTELGLSFFPSAANFFLIRHDEAGMILSALKKRGIMLRNCENFWGLDGRYLRVAVRTKKDNMILLAELGAICPGS